MKNLFIGHYKPTQPEFSTLWNESIFAFDANILLNLYRYSEKTRTELLKVMNAIKEKIWLPHQAAEEYFRNRVSTTGSQANEYTNIEKEIEKIIINLGSTKRHPFLSEDLFNEFKEIITKIKVEFSHNQKQLFDRISNDEILGEITEVFDNKVGNVFTKEELEEIYQDGIVRYENDIPPGYRDGKKDTSGNLYRKFGDLVIWKELIRKSITDSKSIIFITDDKKDDWWLEYSGRTIGPQPALIQEFNEKTGKNFYMYTADRFMDAAKQFSPEIVHQEVIQELQEFRQENERLQYEKYKQLLKILRSSQEKISSDPYIIEDIKITHNIDLEKYTVSPGEVYKFLQDYVEENRDSANKYIGLKWFVTSYLADLKDVEVNSAYKAINDLRETGLIDIYDEVVGKYSVKAIRLT